MTHLLDVNVLLDLARRKSGRLATLDTGIAALVPDRNERNNLLEVIST